MTRKEVRERMRKLIALGFMAVLAVSLAVALMGCGQKSSQSTTETPPAETTMAPDTGMGGMSADTTMRH